MTQKAFILAACIAAIFAAGEARAQEGRSACPANHLAVYNPDTYRNDCISIVKGGDKRSQALLDQQRRVTTRLRREQIDRGYGASQPYEMLKGEQQWRTDKQQRQSR